MVLTAGYMLPWAIAVTRSKPNVASIALVNALLGWTIIGWIAALVMACRKHPGPLETRILTESVPAEMSEVGEVDSRPASGQPASGPPDEDQPGYGHPTYGPVLQHSEFDFGPPEDA